MDYWAHSLDSAEKSVWQPLKDHLHQVAGRAASFASAFDADEAARIVGLCHDLGKYAAEFQDRLLDPRVHVDHSTAGATVAWNKYGSLGRLIAYTIAGHHGGMPDGGSADETGLLYRVSRKDICDFSAYAREIALPSNAPPLTLSPQPGHPGFSASFFTRMLFSCLVDADFLDTEQFLEPGKSHRRGSNDPIEALEDRLAALLQEKTASATPNLVNRKRAEVLEDCLAAAEQGPGLFTLTVPTGGGKTLSSLAFALKHSRLHGLRRVIYVIPFTSIIEQNARVFRDAVGEDAVLEHHSNVAPPQDRPDGLPTPVELAEENWDMPLVVTTNVQFFESLFSNKPSRCRKLHNVAKSVIILDEAQMLPIELLQPCISAVYELVRNYGTTVVLCSATQPALGGLFPEGARPREIVSNPPDLYRSLKRADVKNLGTVDDRDVVERLTDHDQALCIVNTRAHARHIFELLGNAEGHYHLSAAMCPVHRAERLDEIRARLKEGKVCRVVSTQLIEAGVDVDFPFVMRAIAGIDSIAQAAGRCNREGRLRRGEVEVFTPAGREGMSHVWFTRTATIASSILEGEGDPLGLDAVERYFRDLYLYEGKPSNGDNGPSGLDAKGIMQKLEIGRKSLDFPFREVADLFKVIGDDTIGVVIPRDDRCRRVLDEVRFAGISRDLSRQLQPYTVSVRLWECRRLQDVGLLEEVGGLAVLRDLRAYHDDYGLTVASGGEKGSEAWIV